MASGSPELDTSDGSMPEGGRSRCLEVGKVADLVILAADPVQDVRHVSRVVAVVKAGRLYELDGEAQSATP